MGIKHKHAELIKAWADGADIESRHVGETGESSWAYIRVPSWYPECEYRVKTKREVLYGCAKACTVNGRQIGIMSASGCVDAIDNLALTFENDVLVDAKVLRPL